ncbi:MAG: PilZ domain-containing protein, partial [Deltaproteobacteria bacterium]|nr:PilZ domain-containing protein [Deltaproteobacteria bacterium]
KGIYAHLDSDIRAIGEVLNMSRGGLAFKYMAEFSSAAKHSKLNVFALGGKFFLRDVPVKTVSDTEMPIEIDFSSIRMRRMGLEFENMREDQKAALRELILEKKAN